MLETSGQKVLKYNTTKPYHYFISCKDNQKAYQSLEILLIRTTMELIRVYAKKTEGIPNIGGFLDWACQVTDPQ